MLLATTLTDWLQVVGMGIPLVVGFIVGMVKILNRLDKIESNTRLHGEDLKDVKKRMTSLEMRQGPFWYRFLIFRQEQSIRRRRDI